MRRLMRNDKKNFQAKAQSFALRLSLKSEVDNLRKIISCRSAIFQQLLYTNRANVRTVQLVPAEASLSKSLQIVKNQRQQVPLPP